MKNSNKKVRFMVLIKFNHYFPAMTRIDKG